MKKTNKFNLRQSLAFLAITTISSIGFTKEKLFIPSKPKPQAPLFVGLHGCLSDSSVSENSTRLSEFGEKNGFYVLYPEPELGDQSKGCFNFYTKQAQARGAGDAAAIVTRIKDLIKTYDINPEKVFVIGMSGGASLVSVLASCYPDVIHGAAIHSGMGYGLADNVEQALWVAQTGPNPLHERNTSCNPANFKGKLFLVHGSMDPIMNSRHFSQLEKDFLLDTKKVSSDVAPTLTRFGYSRSRYYRGDVLAAHSLWVYGMGHDWSGTKPTNPLSPWGPDVSPMIVEYFLGE